MQNKTTYTIKMEYEKEKKDNEEILTFEDILNSEKFKEIVKKIILN